ncbi:MAG: hypothetical protein VB046_02245 [Paludibacter sp.]|nr:hypothetical protein [Paludibacter sp.]
MKTIKKFTGVLIMLFLFQAIVMPVKMLSQNEKSKNNDFVEVHLTKMKQSITLTSDQEREIRSILAELYTSRENTQKKKSVNSEKILEKKNSLDNYKNKLDNILTEEQKKILFEKTENKTMNAQNRIKL